MADGFEVDLTLLVPSQELAAEAAFFSLRSDDGRSTLTASLLPGLRARLSAALDGAPYIEASTRHPLPVNKVFVLALVVAGGQSGCKLRIHVDDVVAAKAREDKPARALLDPLDAYLLRLNRGADESGGIRMGVVEFVVASKELPALERADSLAYYRTSARRVGHATWFEPDGHAFQHPGATSLKLAPGVEPVPIPASALPRGAR